MDIPTLVTGFLILPVILAPLAAFAIFAMWLDKRIEQGSVKAAVVKAVILLACGIMLTVLVIEKQASGGSPRWDEWLTAFFALFACGVESIRIIGKRRTKRAQKTENKTQ